MNTLGKSITTRFFKTPEDYARLRAAWAQQIQKREKLPFQAHILYLMLMGKDWTKGITPNGPFDAALCAPSCISNKHFYKLVWRPEVRFHEWQKIEFSFKEFLADDAEAQLEALLPQFKDIIDAKNKGEKIPAYNLPAPLQEVSECA